MFLWLGGTRLSIFQSKSRWPVVYGGYHSWRSSPHPPLQTMRCWLISSSCCCRYFPVIFVTVDCSVKIFIRPVALLSVVSNLLTARTDTEAQNLWMALAHQILEIYIRKIDVRCCVSPKRLLKLLDRTCEICTSWPRPNACFRCDGNFVPCCVGVFR